MQKIIHKSYGLLPTKQKWKEQKNWKKEIVYMELHLKLKKRHLDLKSKQKKITGMEAISSDAKILF